MQITAGLVNHWDSYLPSHASDVYFLEDYIALYAKSPGRAVAFLARLNDEAFLFPFIIQPTREGNGIEAISQYGYGGPLTSSIDPVFWHAACSAFLDILRAEGIQQCFFRYHPLLENQRYCEKSMPVKFNRSTIAISNEGFAPDSKLRSEIRKAERNGAIFHEDKGLAHREDFIRLYSMTMERIGAMPFYRFTDEYFDSLFKRLYGRVRLFWSEVDGKVVSSSLFLTQGNFAHYHLAGSDPAFLHMNINAFHLANSIEALWLEGYKHIHLGGGDGPEEDNSLLRFKRKFSNRSLGYYTSNFDLGADGEQRNE